MMQGTGGAPPPQGELSTSESEYTDSYSESEVQQPKPAAIKHKVPEVVPVPVVPVIPTAAGSKSVTTLPTTVPAQKPRNQPEETNQAYSVGVGGGRVPKKKQADGKRTKGGNRDNRTSEARAKPAGGFAPAKLFHSVTSFAHHPKLRNGFLYAYFAFTCVQVLFSILACTLSQLDLVGGSCYTFWGQKANCDSVSYTLRTSLMECSPLRTRLQAGAAFSIFNILLAVAIVILAWAICVRVRSGAKRRENELQYRDTDGPVMTGHNDGNANEGEKQGAGVLKWVVVVLTGCSLFCGLMCWAVITAIFNSRYCEDKNLPRTTAYGAGFGIGLATWLAQLLSLVGVIIIV